MKHTFTLPEFPGSVFEIETSIWTGKSNLWMDEVPVEQSSEKGKPFLIRKADGGYVQAFPKPAFPELFPDLEINGTKHKIVEKLKWYQYALAALPLLLVFAGGAIGGGVGMLGTIFGLQAFRQQGTELANYIKVIAIVVASYILYFSAAAFLHLLIN